MRTNYSGNCLNFPVIFLSVTHHQMESVYLAYIVIFWRGPKVDDLLNLCIKIRSKFKKWISPYLGDFMGTDKKIGHFILKK
jgi:hypothetical protein